jgi:hypothetical protein
MRTLTPSLFLLVALSATPLPAQASFSKYGTACTAPNLSMPAIGATGLPKLNTAFTVTYTGPSQALWPSEIRPVLLTGIQSWNVSIPKLTQWQPLGCTLLVTPDLILPMGTNGPNYENKFVLNIPNDPKLIGLTYYQQWAPWYNFCLVSCEFRAFYFSDAAKIVIGL